MGQVSRADIIYTVLSDVEEEHRMTLSQMVSISENLNIGKIDGKLICIWGVVPTTLLSDKAYLWLYTSPDMKGHEFLFVRKSQIAVKKMLEEYGELWGHTLRSNKKAIRWLEWLGAKFEPNGDMLDFTIRKN